MPQKLHWTPDHDERIRALRGGGASWDVIAAAIGVGRNAVIERGRRLGARLPPPPDVRGAEEAWLADPAREPMPPGHPSWGAITAGTLLEDAAYCWIAE